MSQKITNVYGPPGTGKTRFLIETVKEWLAEGVSPERIGYYSFSNIAVDEARARALDQTAATQDDLKWWATLHACGKRLSGISSRQVADNKTLVPFFKAAGFYFNPYASEDDVQECSRNLREGNILLDLWNFGRNRLCFDAEKAWDVAPYERQIRTDRGNFRYFVKAYEEWKRREGLYDFADMILRGIECGDSTGCTHVAIDEAQDLSPLLWRMAQVAERDACVIFRAGDDDQALMGFTGARPEDYVRIDGDPYVLTQSYRVPVTVHREAVSIIERNRTRVKKEYRPCDVEGKFKRQVSFVPEAWPSEGSIAFLFRNRKHLNAQAEGFMEDGTPFLSNRYKAPLSNRTLVRGLQGIFRWKDKGKIPVGVALDIAALIEDTPKASDFMPYGARKRLEGEARSRPFSEVSDLPLTPEGRRAIESDPLALADAVRFAKPGQRAYLQKLISRDGVEALGRTPRVSLTTVHGAKGAEFDHVYVSQDALRNAQDGFAEDPDTENRAKYVAVTRARQTVTVLPEMEEGGWSI